jgi:hypothetical protein
MTDQQKFKAIQEGFDFEGEKSREQLVDDLCADVFGTDDLELMNKQT